MSVTVSEILVAARGSLAAVSSETAGYLVLGAADCLGEGRLGLKSVYLDEGGALHVDRRGEPGGFDAESSLRGLLKRLLETARSPAPALLRVATTEENRGIPRLITEIEAALIPVNRAAARRALARLHRDVSRLRATSKLFDTTSGALLDGGPSKVPPPVVVARAPERLLEQRALEAVDHSTEGPTPIVSVVEEAAPVLAEAHLPAPAPLLTVERDATPFLGTVATTVRASRSPVPEQFAENAPRPSPPDVAEDPEGDIDTDPAPPVAFEADVPVAAEDRDAATAVLGTYDVAVDVEPDAIDPEPLPASPPPGEAALYVAIPVVALRESAPFVELDELLEDDPADPVENDDVVVGEAAHSEEEDHDVLELLPCDAAEAKEGAADTFTSMFELVPDGTAEPPPVADDDALFESLPPLVFSVVTPQKSDPDSIVEELGLDVPATPLAARSEAEEPPQEKSFGHLTEALIDEALAVAPRPISVLPEIHAPLHAPVVAHTETVPGLGFVNVALLPPVEPEPAEAAPKPEEPVAPGDDVSLWQPERDAWDDDPFYGYEPSTPGAEAGASSVASTYQPRRSDVADLVAAFVVAESRSLAELARELKRIAGISATPAPEAVVSEGRRKASPAR
jgi:hypothetical protein